jgi:sugar phosphate isomerase/epimerase
MTSTKETELLASYFTLAGDVYPFGPTELSPFSFRERAEAASKAGWKGMGLIHEDVQVNAARIGLKEMRKIADDNGIRHLELEFLPNWFKDGELRVQSDAMRREMMEFAVALGLRDIKVAPGLGADIAHPTEAELTPDVDRMIQDFYGVCEDARNAGTNIVLEIMPFSNVRTMETARAVVEGANHPNGGLLIDIWHVSRGNIPFSQVAELPGRFVGAVELDDALAAQEGTLWDDTIYHRCLPGEGDLDQQGFIEAIRATGYDGPWGVEILSETYRKLPLEEMARRSYETTMAQLTQAFEKAGA